jgi:hypothetical protein
MRQCNLQLLGQNMDQEPEGEGEGEGDEEGGYQKGMWLPLLCCLLPHLYVIQLILVFLNPMLPSPSLIPHPHVLRHVAYQDFEILVRSQFHES